MNSLPWDPMMQSSKRISFIMPCENTSETAVGYSLMDPLASFSKKSWNSPTGTMDMLLGSKALSHNFSSSSVCKVKSSKKHFKLKN
jgi:hypothetical protein